MGRPSHFRGLQLHPPSSLNAKSSCSGLRRWFTRLRAQYLLLNPAQLAWGAFLLLFVFLLGSYGLSFTFHGLGSPRCAPASIAAPSESWARFQGPPATQPDKFTYLLNTFHRPRQLQAAVSHYARCDIIDSIVVIWSEDDRPPQPGVNSTLFSPHKTVTYIPHRDTSLNSRFVPVDALQTEAVLSIDDDILVPCAGLEGAFRLWQRHPRTLVGYFPRLHTLSGSTCAARYVPKLSTLLWHSRYSIVLTKAAFMHRDYLAAYTHSLPAEVHEHVRTHRNCEDVAMQLLVAAVSREAPLFYHSPGLVDYGQGLTKVPGISSLGGHVQARSECITAFSAAMGGVVLPTRPLSWHGWLYGGYLRLTPLLDDLTSLISSLRGVR